MVNIAFRRNQASIDDDDDDGSGGDDNDVLDAAWLNPVFLFLT